jgi:hypothetical protein
MPNQKLWLQPESTKLQWIIWDAHQTKEVHLMLKEVKHKEEVSLKDKEEITINVSPKCCTK